MNIITNELLNSLEKNDEIKIMKKEQTGAMVGFNYFILPKLSIKLYKPKVIYVNSKSITFEMSKINTGLVNLLKRCDSLIMNKLLFENVDSQVKYNIFYENENNNTICLRCYLPCYKSKYSIKYYEENVEKIFRLPRSNTILDEVVIDIRNIWCNNNKLGYNLELKYIHVY